MQNALPEGVPWGPVSGATLSLGWRLQTGAGTQQPPGSPGGGGLFLPTSVRVSSVHPHTLFC